MTEPRLVIRSARACEIAHRLAQREKCTVAEVVDKALEHYEASSIRRMSAAEFYASLRADGGDDIDLEAIIQENRKPHPGIDL